MRKLIQAIDFIEDFMRWSTRRRDIRAVGLVGSYAKDHPDDTTDVDLIMITEDPEKYLTGIDWIRVFGVVITTEKIVYGKLTTLHVWYESGLEIEYGITTRDWLAEPLNKETRQVFDEGMRMLFEKEKLLSPYEMPMPRSQRDKPD